MDPKRFEELIKPLTQLVRTHSSPRGPHLKSPEEYADTCRVVSRPVEEYCPDCDKIVKDKSIHLFLKFYASGRKAQVKICIREGLRCAEGKEQREMARAEKLSRPRGRPSKTRLEMIDIRDYTDPIKPESSG
jgi:hypothetical protein